jgi:hypothetical protein
MHVASFTLAHVHARRLTPRGQRGMNINSIFHEGQMTGFSRRLILRSGAVATVVVAAAPAFAQNKPDAAAISLFKVITVKDEIVIGLSGTELTEIGGQDAGAVARALVAKSTLTVWQYAVHKASNGDLEQAPLRKVGLISHDSLRIEPFTTPLKVLPHA